MKPKEKRKLEQQLRQDTNDLLTVIWWMAGDESFADLAKRAGLSEATLYRLWGGLWQRPQLLTLQKLGLAVGLTFRFTQDGRIVNSLDDLAEANA